MNSCCRTVTMPFSLRSPPSAAAPDRPLSRHALQCEWANGPPSKSISKRAIAMDEGLHAWPWLAHTKHEFALALTARGRAGDQGRAEGLFAAAAASAERIGMPALQQKIRSRRH